MDNTVEVNIAANNSALNSGLSDASSVIDRATSTWKQKFTAMFSSVEESSKQMTNTISRQAKEAGEKMEGFAGKINQVHKTMALLAEVAVLGFIGDRMIEMAKKAGEYAHEIELASQKTGVSTDSLQGFGVAAQMTGGSIESMLKGVRKFSQEIIAAQEGSKGAVDAFNKLGISSESLKGMKMEDAMLKVADSFKAHADGAGKAALAQQLFGRAGQELIPFLNLGRDGIQQYMKMAKDLGAVMSKDDVEAAANFKQHLELLHIATEGLERKIGIALIPTMAGLTSAFADSIKPGGQVNDLMNLLPGAINVVAKAVSYAAEGFQILGRRLGAFAAIAVEVLHGNFANAKAIADEFNKDFDSITKSAEKFRASLDKPFHMAKLIQGDEEGGNKPDFQTTAPKEKKPKADKSRVADWREKLEEMKQASGKYLEDDKAADLAYWTDKLNLTKRGSQEWLAVHREMYNLKKGIAQDNFSEEMAKLQDEYSMAKTGSLERINIARQESELIKQTYGERSKQYQTSLRELDKAMKEFSDEEDKEAKVRAEAQIAKTQKMAQLELELETAKLQHKKELGIISDNEMVAAEMALENKKYDIDLKALQDKADLYKDDVKKFEEANAQIEELALRHQIALQKINKPLANPYAKMFDQMNSSFDKAIDGILLGTSKMSNVLKNTWNGLMLQFAHMGIKMVADWGAHQMMMLTVNRATNAAKLADDETAQSQGLAITLWTNMKKIASNAASAAAGAYQAIVGIPYVGPVLAPIAAAVAFAGVMAFGAMASAAGGYDIPSGVNPVVQAHQKEMILPERYANVIRGMASSGAAPAQGGMTDQGAGGGMAMHAHFHVNAIDVRGVKQFFRDNGKHIASTVYAQARNFNPNLKPV